MTAKQIAEDEYKNRLNMAKNADGQENPPELWPEDAWLLSREFE
jgi:hypothetical protein